VNAKKKKKKIETLEIHKCRHLGNFNVKLSLDNYTDIFNQVIELFQAGDNDVNSPATENFFKASLVWKIFMASLARADFSLINNLGGTVN